MPALLQALLPTGNDSLVPPHCFPEVPVTWLHAVWALHVCETACSGHSPSCSASQVSATPLQPRGAGASCHGCPARKLGPQPLLPFVRGPPPPRGLGSGPAGCTSRLGGGGGRRSMQLLSASGRSPQMPIPAATGPRLGSPQSLSHHSEAQGRLAQLCELLTVPL